MVFFVFVAYCYRIGISGVNNSVLHVFIALYSILNVAIKPVHVSLSHSCSWLLCLPLWMQSHLLNNMCVVGECDHVRQLGQSPHSAVVHTVTETAAQGHVHTFMAMKVRVIVLERDHAQITRTHYNTRTWK